MNKAAERAHTHTHTKSNYQIVTFRTSRFASPEIIINLTGCLFLVSKFVFFIVIVIVVVFFSYILIYLNMVWRSANECNEYDGMILQHRRCRRGNGIREMRRIYTFRIEAGEQSRQKSDLCEYSTQLSNRQFHFHRKICARSFVAVAPLPSHSNRAFRTI